MSNLNFGKKAALAVAGIMTTGMGIMNAPLVQAQSAASETPKFDVASIKPNNLVSGGGKAGPSGGVVRFTAGKVAGTATTRTIILAAYHLTEYQLSGGPGWLDNDRFDIEGMAATPTGEEQLRAMLLYRCEHRGRQWGPEAVFQLSYYRPLRRKVGRLESVRYPI